MKTPWKRFDYSGTEVFLKQTARGNVQVTTEITPMFFICVGELLGMIHKASADEQAIGIHYQRKTMKDEHSKHLFI